MYNCAKTEAFTKRHVYVATVMAGVYFISETGSRQRALAWSCEEEFMMGGSQSAALGSSFSYSYSPTFFMNQHKTGGQPIRESIQGRS